MSSDNPEVETADLFYKTAETAELVEQPEVEAVTTDDTQVIEEDKTEIPATEEENSEVTEELESEGAETETESEPEELYIDLDGEEVSLEDVKKWKDDGLRQSDYTKKTTLLADERKAVETERTQLSALSAELNTLKADMQAAIEEDSKLNLADLREFEPEEYAKHLEKRKELSDKIAATATQQVISPEEVQNEWGLLVKSHPDWVGEDGKGTEAYNSDMKLVNDFASRTFTQQEFDGMVKEKYIETILKAAKWDVLQGKSKDIKAKVKKAPLKTRTKQTVVEKPTRMADKFYKS